MQPRHYENFPVASVLLPAPLRPAVLAIYDFARCADDFADEGELPDAQRLAHLNDLLGQLDRIEHGLPARTPLFENLSRAIREHRLPLEPMRALISAFAQDVQVKRYHCFGMLADYCQRSANPVGQLLLRLFKAANEENLRRSDCICSSLQLINFLQDIAVDYQIGRIYLPQDEMHHFGVTEQQLAAHDPSGSWWPLIKFQADRARALLYEGAPLARALPGRIGWEIRMIVMGGDRILKKIYGCRGDVFSRRPVLRPLDWPAILLGATLAYP